MSCRCAACRAQERVGVLPLLVPLVSLTAAGVQAYMSPEARARRQARAAARREAWCAQYGHLRPEELPPEALRPGQGFGLRNRRGAVAGVRGLPMSSPFGPRIHPTLGTRKHHDGIDLAVPEGTPVRALWAGTVQRVDRDGEGKGEVNGNAVVLRHVGGWTSAYAHLRASLVRVGQSVAAGEVIGLSGSTGRSTGPHLHFAVYDPAGQAIDPALFFPPHTFTRV